MNTGKIFILAAGLLLGFLGTSSAHAGGYSGGYWWANCPASITRTETQNVSGSGYQKGFSNQWDTMQLPLKSLTYFTSLGQEQPTPPGEQTMLQCQYGGTPGLPEIGVASLTILAPVNYPHCRATGSFGWFVCHQ